MEKIAEEIVCEIKSRRKKEERKKKKSFGKIIKKKKTNLKENDSMQLHSQLNTKLYQS